MTVQRWAPVELNPDQVACELLAVLKRTSARRLVIDRIGDLERAVIETSGVERVPDFLAALWEILQQQGVMLLALKETPKVLTSELDFSTEPIAVLAENVILLQRVVWREQSRRVLSVLKMSYSAHDTTLREVRIVAPAGFQVLAPVESEAGLLTELTHQQRISEAGKEPPPELPPDSTP